MVSLAADHRAQAGPPCEPAGLGAPLRRNRQLERAWDFIRVNGGRRYAFLPEGLDRAVDEPLSEVLVESRDAHRELHCGEIAHRGNLSAVQGYPGRRKDVASLRRPGRSPVFS